jgi:hypothetical protein
VLAAAAIFSSTPAMAASADARHLAPAIEQCIRDNAAKVEKAIPDLNEALSYLVSGVCSAPIGQEYERLLKIDEQKKRSDYLKMCEQMRSNGASQQPIPTPICEPDVVESTTSPASTGEDVRVYGIQPRFDEAFSLAARLLLDLRLAHLNSKTQ